MKKILVLVLTVVTLLTLSVSAFAAYGGFYDSVVGNRAPILIDYKCDAEDCSADLIITPYAERHTLPEKERIALEKAYEDILANPDLTTLWPQLSDVATKVGASAADLAVIELFDIRYINCPDHGDHGAFDIVIKSDLLKNFVALMHLYNDKWEIVEDAAVTLINGELHLTFTSEEFSPFAIVMSTKDLATPDDTTSTTDNNPDVPTGDTSHMWVYVSIMVVAAAAIVVLLVVAKKQKAN